ncbi:hypothetical protein ACFQ0B_23875 [Nonomuraea thailandensis]
MPLDEELRSEAEVTVVRQTGAAPEMPERWEEVLDLLDPDEPGLAGLVHELAALGAPAPQVGFELGEQLWQAELAWPTAKVAIVLAGDDDEARRRDAAFAEAGWDARTVAGWTPEELMGGIA